MINYDSILSAFDGKPTLLQWLKMVKKALDESVLKDVTIAKDGNNIAFTFNFEDGTSVTTPKVTLPKGNDGVSITGIETVGNEVVGVETLTTLRANYSNNTSNEFVVSAKNGKDASATGNNIYLHSVKIIDDIGNYSISFSAYSNKESLTLNDGLKYIPTAANSMISQENKIPVCFNYSDRIGVVSAAKYDENGKFVISCVGVIVENGTVVNKSFNFIPYSITDTLLGKNL